MNVSARIVSFVFHPLLMTTYLFALLIFLLPAALYPVNSQFQFWFLAMIFMITFLLPALLLSFLKLFGAISSLTLEKRKERIFPFLMTVVLYGSLTYLLTLKSRISFDDNVFKFLLIIDCLVLIGTLFTLFYKVSIHAIGIMGILGVLIPLNKESDNSILFWVTVGVVIIAGLVMSARLQLNAHTPREVFVGALSGFLIGFFGMIILF